MGVIVCGSCSICDYRVTALLGSNDCDISEKCCWPHVCLNCSEVVSIDLRVTSPRCPKCKSTSIIAYAGNLLKKSEFQENEMQTAHAELVTELQFCPRCKRATLKFVDVGLWD